MFDLTENVFVKNYKIKKRVETKSIFNFNHQLFNFNYKLISLIFLLKKSKKSKYILL